MDEHIERFLSRLSLFIATVATLALLHLFSHSTLYCSPSHSPHHPHSPNHTLTLTLALSPFPKSSCDSAARDLLPPDKRYLKLRSSSAFRRRSSSFSSLFLSLRRLRLLSNSSRVLCVAAGAGHEVAALQDSGVADVTAVDLVDFPPLVHRSDPHNLPFFDSVFDLGFTTGLDTALFPRRFAEEIERTVRKGGAVVLVVDRCGSRQEVEGIKALFKRSSLLEVRNVTLVGSEMTMIIMRNNGNPPS